MVASELVVSADSHVIEPHDLWERALPARHREAAPRFSPTNGFEWHPGARSSADRLLAAEDDGVAAEVLYPSSALSLFTIRDVELQQACLRVYNDWLAEYCSVAPRRLVGLPALCAYDIPAAIAEAERCHDAGMQGALLWLVPDPALPYSSPHYEPLWEWAAATATPVTFHILSGFDHTVQIDRLAADPYELYKASVNAKLHGAADTLFDLVFSGVFDRHPGLKIVMGETDAGWLPFYAQRWDHYAAHDARTKQSLRLAKRPSEYLDESVWVTFVDDSVAAHLLQWYGQGRWMWSSDFPHMSSTWPNSSKTIDQLLGDLDDAARAMVLSGSARDLYRFDVRGGG